MYNSPFILYTKFQYSVFCNFRLTHLFLWSDFIVCLVEYILALHIVFAKEIISIRGKFENKKFNVQNVSRAVSSLSHIWLSTSRDFLILKNVTFLFRAWFVQIFTDLFRFYQPVNWRKKIDVRVLVSREQILLCTILKHKVVLGIWGTLWRPVYPVC